MPISSALLATFNIGIPIIDDEHDNLLRVIDELNQCSDELTTSEWFGTWLGRFADLTAAHFDDEEAWMVRLGVPEPLRRKHAQEHQRMLLETRELGCAIAGHDVKTAGDIYKLMKIEFFKHLVQFDAKLKSQIGSDNSLAISEEPSC